MSRVVLAFLLLWSFPMSGQSQEQAPPQTEQDPCAGVTCNGHGTCAVLRGTPVCNCDEGFERPLTGEISSRMRRCVPRSVAERESSPPSSGADWRRHWGLGTRFGVGYLGGGFPAADNVIVVGTGFKIELPTLEFRYFFNNGNSIDLSWSASTTIVAAALGLFYMDPYLHYTINFWSGRSRAMIGLGLRFIFAAMGDFVFGLRVPVNLAIELLSSSGRFGFQFYARPFFHLQPGSEREDTAVGGGIMGGIAFMGYRTRD